MPYEDVLPPRSEVFEHWKDRLPDIGVLLDWGEPSCWACGFHYGRRYDVKHAKAAWATILRGWDRAPFQRCHIVPKSLGGGDEASNLFLMCRECHDAAPNLPFAPVFFEWVRGQNSARREAGKLQEAFISFGLVGEAQDQIARVILSPGFRSWMRGKLGLHRPQSNYASVSSRLTPATMVGLAVYYRRRLAVSGA